LQVRWRQQGGRRRRCDRGERRCWWGWRGAWQQWCSAL
jgi:hypothetical protein